MKQEPFASTLMSSIKTAYEYHYKDKIEDSMLFGLTGHAFLLHITNGLGACAPYTFDRSDFEHLCSTGLGVNVFGESMTTTKDDSEVQKGKVSDFIQDIIDDNELALLSSYEYQVFYDYGEAFALTHPWDEAMSVTTAISLESLEGMLDFFTVHKIQKTEKNDLEKSIRDSLKFAIKMLEEPNSMVDSGFGIEAYDFWLERINQENGVAFGNKWTSTVWAESRKMASNYMVEIKKYINSPLLDELSTLYATSSELLLNIANMTVSVEAKIKLINELKENELKALPLLKKLI